MVEGEVVALALAFPLVFDLDLEGEAEVDEWRVARGEKYSDFLSRVLVPTTSLLQP